MAMAGADGRAAGRGRLTPCPLDNDRVRVLEVVIEPGSARTRAQHRAASVIIIIGRRRRAIRVELK